MSLFDKIGWITWGEPEASTVSRRTLRFIDGTKVTVNGLDEILAELHSEGRPANKETVEEIIKRLEAHQNFIPSSDLIRREYAYILLKEYEEYVASRTDNKG